MGQKFVFINASKQQVYFFFQSCYYGVCEQESEHLKMNLLHNFRSTTFKKLYIKIIGILRRTFFVECPDNKGLVLKVTYDLIIDTRFSPLNYMI